ncbi:MAG: tRNA (adenosine(37)-N6)-threonylcarbamoyltransferase complex transferase subunit TsaD [Candidatus Nealsonbacteria bacterium RIFCSPLOWO2_01_FULL_41_9]|uniref:tRNA N6-adenosine threonylcarbamoyltransferase n=1 Tax=Candidatus Nealsonbacteria bacterium RIFCSPLOWO2_01_FULL_41_9 TaxID=1801671 RepID=A0A1G2EDB4_9BACT|nr:MAG: tRNA (adenosine(37)-N6)-threonylcarbamoyltransferase complex transferase subunit TsaD [Candidatus Nealsonbacteria bacterium RIFCSPLOWO2_01_FULL_41_9]
MLILAIDTSCDETAISIIKIPNPKSQIPNFNILSNIVSSQVKLHAKYGGVYPSLAKREHQKNLPIVLKRALKKAGLALSGSRRVNFIAVTHGPGLEPCLWQGINFAKELAGKLKKPLIAVNHIEAHILANFAVSLAYRKDLFPAVALVVSGGHTQLILMKGIGKYQLIGETRDDAAGECFDKTARILGLGYPGGPVIADKAAKFKVQSLRFKVELPRPMIGQKNYDFSFSGLKTAVLYDFQSRSAKIRKSSGYIQAMCAEIQQSIVDVLIYKTLKVAKDFKVKSIILGGGVAANDELRKQFKSKVLGLGFKVNFLIPPKKLCTDNAVMIAVTAFFNQRKATKRWQKIKADGNLSL